MEISQIRFWLPLAVFGIKLPYSQKFSRVVKQAAWRLDLSQIRGNESFRMYALGETRGFLSRDVHFSRLGQELSFVHLVVRFISQRSHSRFAGIRRVLWSLKPAAK